MDVMHLGRGLFRTPFRSDPAPTTGSGHRTETDEDPIVPGGGIDMAKMPGHWVLAQMGKRVLRPGGRELTDAMLDGLRISLADDVVELAPGMGATTSLVLDRNPASYTGIDRNEEAAAHVRSMLGREACTCEVGPAQDTGLAEGAATVVLGEAFLTMQSDEQKRAIVAEAFRILRPGGRYGMHELTLRPEDLDPQRQADIRGELSRSIHVGARPVTVGAWREILESVGFETTFEQTAPMALLDPRRLIADEGYRGAATLAFNVARNPGARSRILDMREMFQRNADQLGAVTLVATKP